MTLLPKEELTKLNILENNPEQPEGNERLGVKYAIFSTVTFGFISFQIKLAKTLYADTFDPNVFLFWRSLSSSILAYAIVKYKSEKILKISEIKTKFWFAFRCIFNYINLLCLTLCMVELRAATASCMSSMSPAIMIFFSIWILGEKFHIRYLTGILICFAGSALIVLNEKKSIPIVEDLEMLEEMEQQIEKLSVAHSGKDLPDMIQGVFYGIYHIFFNSLISVSQKLLAREKIPIETQVFYIGMTNSLIGLVLVLIMGFKSIDLSFGLFCSFNGLIFYVSLHYMNESLKNMPLAKFTPFLYLATLTVFACGVVFVGEPLYFTDIIGSLLILSFNVFNSYYPIKNN